MGPPSPFGVGPLRLAIFPATVLLALGAYELSPSLVSPQAHASSRLQTSVLQPPARFEMRPFCPVITMDPGGACPLLPISRPLPRKPPVIVLCSESVCGSGFRPGDSIELLATRAEGSTFWRTVADRSGNFSSTLPAPLCRFAPIGLTAFESNDDQSNRLSVASTGCEKSIP
jgi:hypothetical protein